MIKKILYKCRGGASAFKLRLKATGKQKIFCIGRNKTGTTSIGRAFVDLGFVVGSERKAEILYDQHYFLGNFDPIIRYCRSAQVFQDVPFSCPDTYNEVILKAHYNAYNAQVQKYFKGREQDLLIINIAEEGAYQKFIDFIGVDSQGISDFPWVNKK